MENEYSNYLKKIDRKKYGIILSNPIKKEPFIEKKIPWFYNQVIKNKMKVNFGTKIKIRIMPILLPIWKYFFYPIEFYLTKKKFTIQSFKKLESKKIVFHLAGSRSFINNLPLVKELVKKGVKPIIITNKKTFKNYDFLKECKIIFEDLEIKNLHYPYLSLKKIAKGQFNNFIKNIEDEVLPNLFKKYKDFFIYYLMIENLLYSYYKKLFSKIEPKVVVSNDVSGGLLKICKEKKIKSVAIQHGVISKKIGCIVPYRTDVFIAWGKAWADNFQGRISKNTDFVAIGNHKLDEIAHLDKHKKSEFYEKFNLKKDMKTIVFLSQSHGPYEKGFYDKIIKDIGEISTIFKEKINFIIKLHPAENKLLYKKNLKDEIVNSMTFIKNETSLYKILQNSDVSISVNSTALIESAAFQIPIIQFDYHDKNKIKIDYEKDFGAKLVHNKNELEKNINKLLSKKKFYQDTIDKQNKHLKKYLTNLGEAKEKIVKYLIELNNQKRF